jgi:2,4-dienoyl-CoA reductase (NADPH2)
VFLDQTVDEDLITACGPDHVILATGTRPYVPPIAGVDQPHVVQA